MGLVTKQTCRLCPSKSPRQATHHTPGSPRPPRNPRPASSIAEIDHRGVAASITRSEIQVYGATGPSPRRQSGPLPGVCCSAPHTPLRCGPEAQTRGAAQPHHPAPAGNTKLDASSHALDRSATASCFSRSLSPPKTSFLVCFSDWVVGSGGALGARTPASTTRTKGTKLWTGGRTSTGPAKEFLHPCRRTRRGGGNGGEPARTRAWHRNRTPASHSHPPQATERSASPSKRPPQPPQHAAEPWPSCNLEQPLKGAAKRPPREHALPPKRPQTPARFIPVRGPPRRGLNIRPAAEEERRRCTCPPPLQRRRRGAVPPLRRRCYSHSRRRRCALESPPPSPS